MFSTPPVSRSFWRPRTSPSSSKPAQSQSPTSTSPTGLRAALKAEESKQLGELNECLAVLAAIFPDVQPQVFREMLQTFSRESRLELITEAMLKHQVKWVRGRWRVPAPETATKQLSAQAKAASSSALPATELFRSMEYKQAVKQALYDEFKGLSHWTIKAILAENNYSYSEAREALLEQVTTSWRFSIAKFIFRRKVPAAEDHPFLRWKTVAGGAQQPYLLATGSEELDGELRDMVFAPLQAEILAKQLASDREIASKLNEEEAETAGATFDCECCFTSSTFEETTTCDTGGHFICFRCIRHTMNEALYGQGWAKAYDPAKCSIRCVALSAGQDESCSGSIPIELVERAVQADIKHEETLRKFHQRAVTEGIQQSRLRVRQCPSCAYAEVEAEPKPPRSHDKLKLISAALLTIICTFATLLYDLNLLQLLSTYTLILSGLYHLTTNPSTFLPSSSTSLTSPTPATLNNGVKFLCRSPTCLTTSCLRCLIPWTDPHTCYTSTRLALRTYVDAALSAAIKRTCPRCNLSFIKSSGCNKLVCPCGYKMCYVCRADVGKEGYMHFCQHFRAEPGTACTECDRCDLYVEEGEGVVLERARKRAVREWREMVMMGRKEGEVEGLEEVEREVLGGGSGGYEGWKER